MKTKEQLLRMLFEILAELQSGTTKSNKCLDASLRTKLELLYEILEDEVPEEYWEQIENEIYAD